MQLNPEKNHMKRTVIICHFITLLICVLTYLKTTAIWSVAAIDWLLPGGQVNTSALLLAIVYNIAMLCTIVFPLSWSGRNQLVFGAGFGVCLGLVLLAAVGMKPGILQCIASFALASYERQPASRNMDSGEKSARAK